MKTNLKCIELVSGAIQIIQLCFILIFMCIYFQPDAESAYLAEQKRNAAKAANRGKEARRLKILLDDENKHRGEAPLIRKQLTRTKEDIRSIFVSSLSPPPIRSCSK